MSKGDTIDSYVKVKFTHRIFRRLVDWYLEDQSPDKSIHPDAKGHADWCNATGTFQTTEGVFCASCNRLLHR